MANGTAWPRWGPRGPSTIIHQQAADSAWLVAMRATVRTWTGPEGVQGRPVWPGPRGYVPPTCCPSCYRKCGRPYLRLPHGVKLGIQRVPSPCLGLWGPRSHYGRPLGRVVSADRVDSPRGTGWTVPQGPRVSGCLVITAGVKVSGRGECMQRRALRARRQRGSPTPHPDPTGTRVLRVGLPECRAVGPSQPWTPDGGADSSPDPVPWAATTACSGRLRCSGGRVFSGCLRGLRPGCLRPSSGGGAHLAQQAHHLLGPAGDVLHARRAEQLHQGLHGVAGVDVVGPLGRGRQRCAKGLTPQPEAPATRPPLPPRRCSSRGSPGPGRKHVTPERVWAQVAWPRGQDGLPSSRVGGPRGPQEGTPG